MSARLQDRRRHLPRLARRPRRARARSRLAGGEPVALWHGDADLHGVDAVVLPGGFSYGDYLRCGAIARFAPVMEPLVDGRRAAACRCWASATASRCCASRTCCPGALIRNDHLHFVCRDQRLRIENAATAWTGGYAPGQEIVVPLKNGEGGYVADERTLDELEAEGRVVARYLDVQPQRLAAATSPASATSAATSSA